MLKSILALNWMIIDGIKSVSRALAPPARPFLIINLWIISIQIILLSHWPEITENLWLVISISAEKFKI